MPARLKALCLDAHDHKAIADWWCAALGYRRRTDPPHTDEGDIPIIDPAGVGPLIWVCPVPEPKIVKNRLHLDVYGDRDEFLALGATVVRAKGGDIDWDVMADPEGNEFCVFEAPAPAPDRTPAQPTVG